MKKAVILLSGGLDSATVLAMARVQGFDCYTLSFDYGQRAKAELKAAALLAEKYSVKQHLVQTIHLESIGGSALTDTSIAVPEHETEGIPVTYVPARNTLFLSFALSWAEVLQSKDIFIGVNAVDFSGYPDCRQEFISAFEKTANLATKIGVEEGGICIHTPLIDLTKAEIVQAGTSLGVDYALTISCYQATDSGAACGRCDSCRLRKQGFKEADLADPTLYQ